jgi:uncharacterized protein (DUF2062 family)
MIALKLLAVVVGAGVLVALFPDFTLDLILAIVSLSS